MNVLVTAGRFPYPPDSGGSLRVYHLLRLLAQRHRIHLITAHAGKVATGQLEHMRSLGVTVAVTPAPVRPKLQRLAEMVTSSVPDMALRLAGDSLLRSVQTALASQPFDVIHIAGLEAAEPVRRALGDLPGPRPAIVLDAFNAEYVLQRRAWEVDAQRSRRWPQAVYSFIQWRKLARYEAAFCQRSDLVLAMSAQDREALVPVCGTTPVEVAPHGVDTERYAPDPALRATVPTVLFIGTLDFRPNVDAAVWLARDIWPAVRQHVPAARLLLVGRDPTAAVRALDGDGITVTGAVPDDLPSFQQATVFALPMRYGGGVRLKLLQALSAALPVVTTRMGAEGVELRDGQHALLADGPRMFADAIVRVLRDPGLARRLGDEGRSLVQRHYQWENTAAIVEGAWETAVSRAASAGLRSAGTPLG